MRQNDWTLGANCATYCRTVTQRHSLEDAQIYPHLRRAGTGLAPVIDRLEQEHHVIHDVLEGVDRALVDFVRTPEDFSGLQLALDLLTDSLLSHLAYENTGSYLEKCVTGRGSGLPSRVRSTFSL